MCVHTQPHQPQPDAPRDEGTAVLVSVQQLLSCPVATGAGPSARGDDKRGGGEERDARGVTPAAAGVRERGRAQQQRGRGGGGGGSGGGGAGHGRPPRYHALCLGRRF